MLGADTIAGTAHVVRTGRGFPILRVSPSPSFTASGLSIVTSVLSSTRPTPPSPPARYVLPSYWAGECHGIRAALLLSSFTFDRAAPIVASSLAVLVRVDRGCGLCG